jgi:hypothetical protein
MQIVHEDFPLTSSKLLFAVLVAGKGTNKKTTLYVGGLEENVNEAILHSAFIPFGDIKDVNIPLDNTTGKHRGFGFVEYENAAVSTPLSAQGETPWCPIAFDLHLLQSNFSV